jgi:hypothetical protein
VDSAAAFKSFNENDSKVREPPKANIMGTKSGDGVCKKADFFLE